MTIAKTLTPIFSKVQNRNSFTAHKQNWAKRKRTCPYAGASKPKQRWRRVESPSLLQKETSDEKP